MSGSIRVLPILLVLSPLCGCEWVLGESFEVTTLRDPKTGQRVECAGHIGRGGASRAETEAMNACAASYLSQGYAKE